ncbi:MAG: hypothetical protein N2V75_11200 [Methanophagales archaeon]|nr:hypothetical protein [Methanophagales archaeon]
MIEHEHLEMLKEAVEEIEEKVANLKALIALIREWEAKKRDK